MRRSEAGPGPSDPFDNAPGAWDPFDRVTLVLLALSLVPLIASFVFVELTTSG